MKKKNKLGVTVGGPTPNINFIIKLDKKHYFFPTADNPIYCGAYYSLVNRLTPLGEQIAVFIRYLERKK